MASKGMSVNSSFHCATSRVSLTISERKSAASLTKSAAGLPRESLAVHLIPFNEYGQPEVGRCNRKSGPENFGTTPCSSAVGGLAIEVELDYHPSWPGDVSLERNPHLRHQRTPCRQSRAKSWLTGSSSDAGGAWSPAERQRRAKLISTWGIAVT